MRDKRLVAASFSRAAASYDQVASLQRRIADRLSHFLGDSKVHTALDLGCGTGYANTWLQARASHLINVDLAEGMLNFARLQGLAGTWVAGDAEQLPLADNSVELIWSNLALQWSEQPQLLFNELARVMKPKGRLLIATLGENTLSELRTAWKAVDDFQHVNQFYEIEKWLGYATPFTVTQHHQQQEVMYYSQVSALMRELRHLGAHNVNPARRSGLGGQTQLRAMMQAYEQFRDAQNRLPASYEVHYLELIKS